MNTKKRIIKKAIKLYNELGFANVTSRRLAEALQMSHGNLEYHYKNKEAILLAIYHEMREEISGVYDNSVSIEDPLIKFNKLLIALDKFHSKYAFFNTDVVEISRKHKKVNEYIQNTLQIRKDQMTVFFREFQAYDYFKKQEYDHYYMRLQHTIRILITFWKSQEKILQNYALLENNSMATYIWDLILPHLSEKGLKMFNQIISKR